MTQYVAGLDLSLRATGIALVPFDWAPGLDWRRVIVRQAGLALTADAEAASVTWRTIAIAEAVLKLLRGYDVLSVWVEEYSFSKGDARSHQLGELGGVMKAELYKAGYSFGSVFSNTARAHLGKFSRGKKGEAKRPPIKDQVRAALRSLGAPADWTKDEADAFVIGNGALIKLGHQGLVVPREAPAKRPRARRAA